MNLAEAYVTLTTTTGLGEARWNEILSLPEPARTDAVIALKAMDWYQDPDRLGPVLAALGVIGTILGVVGTGAGAISAVAALRSA